MNKVWLGLWESGDLSGAWTENGDCTRPVGWCSIYLQPCLVGDQACMVGLELGTRGWYDLYCFFELRRITFRAGFAFKKNLRGKHHAIHPLSVLAGIKGSRVCPQRAEQVKPKRVCGAELVVRTHLVGQKQLKGRSKRISVSFGSYI